MKLWIARAKIGYITLHYSKPKEKNGGWNDVVAVLGDNYFPEVTFENSPQEVEIKFASTGSDRGKRDSIIRGLKQLEHDYMLSYEEEIDWLNKLVEE